MEDYYRKIVRSRLSESGQKMYDHVNWFVRMRWFDYLGMGFLLLRIDATWTYWTAVYFAGHLSLVILLALDKLPDCSRDARDERHLETPVALVRLALPKPMGLSDRLAELPDSAIVAADA